MAVVGRESALGSRRLLEVKLPCRLGIGDFRCGADARIRAFGPKRPSILLGRCAMRKTGSSRSALHFTGGDAVACSALFAVVPDFRWIRRLLDEHRTLVSVACQDR